ncbi:MAG: hypothetical protein ACI4MF_04420 [Candidatus Faecivicinus sp.]
MQDEREPFHDVEDVASATECTGLMPVLPKDEGQNVNYAELYAIHKAAGPRRKKK